LSIRYLLVTMNSPSPVDYSPFQKLHPLSLLAQLISRQVSGHLRLSMGTLAWSLVLNRGKLLFATSTEGAFDRLDQHLRRLSADIPTLVSAVRVQLRLLFDQGETAPNAVSPDYQAIAWLVEQEHMTAAQAAGLIEALAIDVIDPFLGIREGHYELLDMANWEPYPQFCQLDLRSIVEMCQKRRKERLSYANQPTPTKTAVTSPETSPWQTNQPREPLPVLAGLANSVTNGTNPQNGSNNGSNNGSSYHGFGLGETPAPNALGSANPLQEAPSADTSYPPSPKQIPAYDPALYFRPAARLNLNEPASGAMGTASPNQMDQSRGLMPSAPQGAPVQAAYTIACIDDSPTVLNAIQEFLDDKSLRVVAISDPVKALMQIMRSKPDLILLDVTMPNLDGYELCSLLRRHPHFKNTPIIMVTGNTGLIDRAKAKLVRASGYLTKPFSQSDLLKMVFMHLSNTPHPPV
jgi:two-component system, chemotaxis family, response regulator PixG